MKLVLSSIITFALLFLLVWFWTVIIENRDFDLYLTLGLSLLGIFLIPIIVFLMPSQRMSRKLKEPPAKTN